MAVSLVSVVVPVHNGAQYLHQALDSVLQQTYRPLQVVVVDDGSTDASMEVIASYGHQLQVIRQSNRGVAHARNTGIAAARGEFIAFLDQDDWWLPEKVARQVELLRGDGSLGLVHTNVVQYSEAAGDFVDPVFPTDRAPTLQGPCYDQLLLGNGIFNSSVMVRRTALAKVGLFDLGIPGNTVQDYDLWLRIARHFPLGYVPDELTVVRLHDAQGTWNRRAMLGDELQLLERVVGKRQLRRSSVMRGRVAALCDELGVAHLDAGEHRPARRCFVRALRARWSARAALLCAVSFLPTAGVAWLRRQRARWRCSPSPALIRATEGQSFTVPCRPYSA